MPPRSPLLPLLFGAILVLLPAVSILAEDDRRIEPFGGILWNDRAQEVLRKMGGFPGVRRVEVSLSFHDRVTSKVFGPRAIDPGDGKALPEAVSALVREYLDAIEAESRKGNERPATGFRLHCAEELVDKEGGRKSFLNATIRLEAKRVPFQGLPFDLSATFRTSAGAGLTERNTIPVAGTKYILPAVLTKVALASRSPEAKGRYAEIEEALGRRYGRFPKCGKEVTGGWCDDRPVSVSCALEEPDTVAVRYDAEKYRLDGLDSIYREHLAAQDSPRGRCHSFRVRGA